MGTAAVAARPARAAQGARIAAGVRGIAFPLGAFVASRLLSVLGGVVGVHGLHKHTDAVTVAVTRHQLGSVGYVLAGSIDRFDAVHYLRIAAHGYTPGASGDSAFFPLYPLLIRALAYACGSPVIAGAAISSAAFLVALVLLHRLTEFELGRRAADATVLLVAFAPLSFFFTAIYTESLFLALSVGSVLAARRGRWRLACGLAALATLTRVTGMVLALGLAVMRIRQRGGLDRGLAWLATVPAAFVAFMVTLLASGLPALAMFTVESQWNRHTVGPVGGLFAGIWAAGDGLARLLRGVPIYHPTMRSPFSLSAESVLLLGVVVVAACALVACWRRLGRGYAIYATVALLVVVSSPAVYQPLVSVDRYVLTIFPLWMAAGAWVAERRLERVAVVLGGVAMVFFAAQFASWAFVA